jgi:hypothetical protein
MKRPRLTPLILFFAQVFVLFLLINPQNAEAIPAYARKYDMTCGGCHTAWPMLNEAGREFKENGYQYTRGDTEGLKTISDHLQFDKDFPVSGVLIARPFDKKKDGDEKIRALHEAELIVSGQMFRDVSGFFELEAEDETGFEIEIPILSVGYHPYPELNVQFAYSPFTWSDPYDTYADHRRLTRGHASVVDQNFGGVDGKLRSARQNINVYGRTAERVFYNFGVSGLAGDPEGENPQNIHARVAFDVIPTAMIGFLGIKGKNDAEDLDYNRIGIDGQVDIEEGRIMGAFVRGTDDVTADTDQTNNAWYVQGLYVVQMDGRPTWVPLARIDSYEINDGEDDYRDITLNLGYYFTENLKGIFEFWSQVSVPDGQEKNNRVTLQFSAAM